MAESPEQLSLPLVELIDAPERPAVEVVSAAISRDELNALPIRSYQGPVVLVTNDEEMEHAVEALRKEELLGFDTETKPVFRAGISHPPSLLQLAGEDQAWIFQLRHLRRLNQLFSILADKTIAKAGVALADDLKKLREVQDFKPARFTELGDLAKKLGYRQTGLRTLAGLVLGFRISKREQRSNWARQQLTPSQIMYAATDAWVSRELHLALTHRLNGRAHEHFNQPA